MTERIRSLVKRLQDTRPVQSARRAALADDLKALRRDLDSEAVPDQACNLDAALLLMEFMQRSDDVATAETLQIVAGLVSTIDERSLRTGPPRAHVPHLVRDNVSEHGDLRLTHEALLGAILVQAGVVSAEMLTRGLQLHSSSGQPLGQCLVQLGAATPGQIESAVVYQDRMREDERSARREPERGASAARNDLRLSAKQKTVLQSINSQVLGEVLVRLGSVSREQLERALQVQRAAGVHIGQALVETRATTWEQIKRALDVQRQLRRAA
ncbi:MAG: hypothetical protein ABL998_06680 [Planctomycetota bacterium]